MESQGYIKLIFYILILLAISWEIIGDIYFKKWSLNGKNSILILGIISIGLIEI